MLFAHDLAHGASLGSTELSILVISFEACQDSKLRFLKDLGFR